MPNQAPILDSPENTVSSIKETWQAWLQGEITKKNLNVKNRPFEDASEVSTTIAFEEEFLPWSAMQLNTPFDREPFSTYLRKNTPQPGEDIVFEVGRQSFDRNIKICRSAQAWGERIGILNPTHKNALKAFMRTIEKMERTDILNSPEGLFPFQEICIALFYECLKKKNLRDSAFLVDNYAAFYATGNLRGDSMQNVRMATTRLMIHLADAANPLDDIDFFHALNDLLEQLDWLQTSAAYDLRGINEPLSSQGLYNRIQLKRNWPHEDNYRTPTPHPIHVNVAWMVYQLWNGAFKVVGQKGSPKQATDRSQAIKKLLNNLGPASTSQVIDSQAASNALKWMNELAKEAFGEEVDATLKATAKTALQTSQVDSQITTPPKPIPNWMLFNWGNRLKIDQRKIKEEIQNLKRDCSLGAKTVIIPGFIRLRKREQRIPDEIKNLFIGPLEQPSSTETTYRNLECEARFRFETGNETYEIRCEMNTSGELTIISGTQKLTEGEFKHRKINAYLELQRLMLLGLKEMLVEKSAAPSDKAQKNTPSGQEPNEKQSSTGLIPHIDSTREVERPTVLLGYETPLEANEEKEINEMDASTGTPRNAQTVLEWIDPRRVERWTEEEKSLMKTIELYEMKTVGEKKHMLSYPARISDTLETLQQLKEGKLSPESIYLRGRRPYLKRPGVHFRTHPTEKGVAEAVVEQVRTRNQKLLELIQQSFKIRLKGAASINRRANVNPETIKKIRVHLPESLGLTQEKKPARIIEIDVSHVITFLKGEIDSMEGLPDEINWEETVLVEEPEGKIGLHLKLKMDDLHHIVNPGFFMSIGECERRILEKEL